MTARPKVVLAFSGGLDTSYCAIWLREQGYDVHTATVLTASASSETAALESRVESLGVAGHKTIDARCELYDDYLRYLIFANVLRGDVYPLSVAAERVVQAKLCAQYALEIGATALAHGSTGAGNDQVRFDIVFGVVAPNLKIITPIREQSLSREQETEYLKRHGVIIPNKTTVYSVNRGLWGATIGGAETHTSDGVVPEEAYELTAPPDKRPPEPEEIDITFDRGVPTSLNGEAMTPVELIESLDERGGLHGVGRGIHVGDTIFGIKGRIAFEAPAATILISAHRELEKLVLSRQQLMWKRTLGDAYGAFLHESRFFDPLMRDIEAFLNSSQTHVSGSVRVKLFNGQATVLGAKSEHSLLNPEIALYGEQTSLWSGEEAVAFAKIYGLQDRLFARLHSREGEEHAHLA